MTFSRELFQQGMKHTDHREKDQGLGDKLYHSEHNCAAPPQLHLHPMLFALVNEMWV